MKCSEQRIHMESKSYSPAHTHNRTIPDLNMTELQSNIRTLFASSKAQRKALESNLEPNSAVYHENVQAALETLEECRRLARSLSLFSPNENEEDIASSDLQ